VAVQLHNSFGFQLRRTVLELTERSS